MALPEGVITSPAEVDALPVGQWIWDATGSPHCLVDTHVGAPQRMWMSRNGNSFNAVDSIPYPLTLAEIDEPDDACLHLRVQECGHCRRCGRVVAEPRPLFFLGLAFQEGQS